MTALVPSPDLVISGMARQGHELLAMVTLDDLRSSASLRYQWVADGVPLQGATGKALPLQADHVGKALSVRLSYVDALGQLQTAESQATPAVAANPAGQGVQVAIRLTQSAMDSLRIGADADSGLDRIVDGMVQLQAQLENVYSQSVRYTVSPNQVTGYFSDGSTRTRQFVKDDPTATAGMATVSQWEFVKPGAFVLTYGGQLRYAFNETIGLLQFQQGRMTDYALLNQVEHPQYGRQSVAMRGDLATTGGADWKLQGQLTSLHMTASQHLESVSFEGQLQVSGDFSDIASGLARSRVDGLLSGLQQRFRDGSVLSLGGRLDGQALQVIDGQLRTDAGWLVSLPGDDRFELDLPAQPDPMWNRWETGEGNDWLTLRGGGGLLSVDAGPGDDRVVSGAGSHQMAGGSGNDTLALPGSRQDYLLRWSGPDRGFSLQSGDGEIDQAHGFERVEFAGMAFTLEALEQSTVAWVRASTWTQAALPGLSLGVPGAQTDAQGWVRLRIESDTQLPAAGPADAQARAHVNLQDAIVVLKSVVGLVALNPFQRLAADVDGQAEVGLSDAIAILKHVVGLPTPAPAWTYLRDPADPPAPGGDPMRLVPGQDQQVRLIGVLIGDVDGSWSAG